MGDQEVLRGPGGLWSHLVLVQPGGVERSLGSVVASRTKRCDLEVLTVESTLVLLRV